MKSYPHNHTYVCPSCHHTARDNAREQKPCGCGQVMIELDHRWRVPKKGDKKGWKVLESAVNRNRLPEHRSLFA